MQLLFLRHEEAGSVLRRPLTMSNTVLLLGTTNNLINRFQ